MTNNPEQVSTGIRPLAVVVIPTYDECENISPIIHEILNQQQYINTFDLHVLVSDSHSRDGTLDIVQKLTETNSKVHLLDVQQRGIGIGLYRGFVHAISVLKAEVLVQMDADFQHNPEDIPTLIAGISEGYDLVVGSRFIRGSENHMPWYRRMLSIGANFMIRQMLDLKQVTEITTSYRAFTSEIFLKIQNDDIPWERNSFIAVPVALVRMIDRGARSKEIPMTMSPRLHGYSKLQYGRYIRDIFLFSVKTRLGKSLN